MMKNTFDFMLKPFISWTNNKNKGYNISDCWSRDMHNLDFSEKGLEISEKGFSITFSVLFLKKSICHVTFC